MQYAIGKLLTQNGLLHLQSEILKLAQAAAVLPVTSVECERVFSAMTFLKTALRNKLKNRSLNALLHIKLSGPALEAFDFAAAVRAWDSLAARRIRFVPVFAPAVSAAPAVLATAASAALATASDTRKLAAAAAQLAAGQSPRSELEGAFLQQLGRLESDLQRLCLLAGSSPPAALESRGGGGADCEKGRAVEKFM